MIIVNLNLGLNIINIGVDSCPFVELDLKYLFSPSPEQQGAGMNQKSTVAVETLRPKLQVLNGTPIQSQPISICSTVYDELIVYVIKSNRQSAENATPTAPPSKTCLYFWP